MQLRSMACAAAWLATCLAIPQAPAAAQGAPALLGTWKGEAFGFSRQQRPFFILLVEQQDGRLQCWMSADNEPPKSRPAQCALSGSRLQLTTWNSNYVTLSPAGNRLKGYIELSSGASALVEFQR
jgi:hypothetical protein